MKATTTFRDWLILAEAAGFKLEGTAQRPTYIGKKKTPESLQDMTFGQIVELTKRGDDMAKVVCVTMGMEREEVMRARATEVVRYVVWVTAQLERINKMFETLKSAPTAEELRAGVDALAFGIFGMIDTYARRMGITNHDEVLATPWMVVFKCLQMDKKIQDYEKRYNKIMQEQIRSKK